MTFKPWPFHPAWEIGGFWDAETFFPALALLVPFPFYLRLHCVPDHEIRAFFKAYAVAPLLELEDGSGSINDSFHLLATRVSLRKLAELAGRHAAPEICLDMHAYGGRRVFVEWYDAFWDNPVLVADEISEAAVSDFCETLGLDYYPAQSYWRDS